MNDLTFTPLRSPSGSATDQVFDALYEAVILTNLPPGTKVSESDIAKQLDVSRQPVRDAFFRLSNLGFLAIRPQRATLITQISVRAVHNAMFTRTALEVECLRNAMADNRDALIEALTQNLTRQKQSNPEDAASFHALDESFHEAICTHSGHAHVWALIRAQKGHLDRIRFLTLSQLRHPHVISEHQTILDAITTNDSQAAETLLRQHIKGVIHILPQIITAFPEYFDNDT